MLSRILNSILNNALKIGVVLLTITLVGMTLDAIFWQAAHEIVFAIPLLVGGAFFSFSK